MMFHSLTRVSKPSNAHTGLPSNDYSYRYSTKWFRWFAVCTLLMCAAGCDLPNNPYERNALGSNTLYTAFTERSPKYLDPASSYSTDETPYTYQIYEPPYGYDYLKRPYRLIPRAAAALAEPEYFDAQGHRLPTDAPGNSIAYSVYDIPIQHGIQYQPHPAFARDKNGVLLYHQLQAQDLTHIRSPQDFSQRGSRELTAHDYVYAIRRLASPRLVSPLFGHLSKYIVGLEEYGNALRRTDEQLRSTLPPGSRELPWLDFRRYAFEGVEAPDDYILRIKVRGKYPQFKYWLAMTFFAPVAWEVDRFYAQPGMAAKNLTLNHWPVGTGPYMLTQYQQNRRHVLERNPYFRGVPYPCEGEPGDAARGLLKDCGKKAPFIDRIVFTLEKESSSLEGKFMQGYYDIPEAQRGEYGVDYLVAIADYKESAKNIRERNISLPTTIETQNWYMGFNWLDPVVGQGDTPQARTRNRKLRQAISIAVDWEEYVAIFEKNQGEVAHGPLAPGLFGYRNGPAGMNPVVYRLDSQGKPQRRSLDEARRLMAEAGYPGGRDIRSGQPLVINYDYQRALSPGAKPVLDWMTRQFAKLGIQLEIRATDYNRFQDKMRNGTAQLFWWGWNADYPDAENFLFLLYGPNAKAQRDGENAANYHNPDFDALFDRMKFLDDGPEKQQLIDQMVAMVREDAVWMFGYYPKSGGAYHQWVANGKPTQMVRNHLMYMRVDPALRLARVHQWNRPRYWPLPLLVIALGLLIYPAWRTWRGAASRNAWGEAATHSAILRDSEARS